MPLSVAMGTCLLMLGDDNFKIKVKHLIRISRLHCVDSVNNVRHETKHVPFAPPPNQSSTICVCLKEVYLRFKAIAPYYGRAVAAVPENEPPLQPRESNYLKNEVNIVR